MGSTYAAAGSGQRTNTASNGTGYTAQAAEIKRIMTSYAIVPLNAQLAKDAQVSLQGFDKWIRELTGGKLTLANIETVASAVPILGNLLAAADVLTGLYRISQKQEKADFVDWFGIGIDAIGVVPVPALATTRIAMRPALGLLRQELIKSGPNIGEAVLGVIADHLISDLKIAEKVAQPIEDFLAKIQSILNDVVKFLQSLIDSFCDFLLSLVQPGSSYRRSKIPAFQKGKNFRSPKQESSLFGFVLSFYADVSVAAVTEVARLSMSNEQKKNVEKIAGYLKKEIRPKISSEIMALADEKVQGSIVSLLKRLLVKIKPRAKANASATPAGKAVAEVKHGDKTHEKTNNQDKVNGSPNACKVCPDNEPQVSGKDGHAVQLGLGNETFSHTDFVLPGVMPLVWTRSYNSRLSRFDGGMVGARWLTPFHTCFEVQDGALVYIDAQGRELNYPLLNVGEHHQDRSEGLMLSRLDEKLLSVTRGHELLELYELRGERFLLSLLRDRVGNQIVLDYDAAGRMTRLRSGDGPWVLVQTDAAGRIEKLTQTATGDAPVRVLAQYRYDAAGDLVNAIDENGHQREYRYQNHLVTRYTDRTGRGMNLEWDGREATSRVIREYADDGSSEMRLEYSDQLRLTIVTDALNHDTYYYLDEMGYPYRTVFPDGSESWVYRDEFKNLTKRIHPDGSKELYYYDERDNLIEHVRADASIVRMQYDDKDQLIKITDPNGEEWLREYDAKGNLVKETDPLGHSMQYAYNAQGLPVEIKDAKGGSKKLAYTDTGLLLSYTDCSSKTSRWTYDERGRIKAAQDAAGGITRYQYGAAGQLEKVIQPDTTEIKLEYDAEGRLLTHIDALDRTTRYAYDKAGRISGRIDAAGQQLNYAYDKLNQLITLTNKKWNA